MDEVLISVTTRCAILPYSFTLYLCRKQGSFEESISLLLLGHIFTDHIAFNALPHRTPPPPPLRLSETVKKGIWWHWGFIRVFNYSISVKQWELLSRQNSTMNTIKWRGLVISQKDPPFIVIFIHFSSKPMQTFAINVANIIFALVL